MFDVRHITCVIRLGFLERTALAHRLGLLGTVASIGLTIGTASSQAAGSGALVLPSLLSSKALYAQAPSQSANESNNPPQTTGAPTTETTKDDAVPFSELNAALQAAQARLAELSKAAEIARVAGKLRESLDDALAENQQLRAALAELQFENGQLQLANDETRRRAEEAEQGLAESRQLQVDLVASREQNGQLTAELAEAKSLALEEVSALESRIAMISAEAESATTEVIDLRQELEASRDSAQIAEQRSSELDEQLAASRLAVSQAEAETAKLTKDLDLAISELNTARTELEIARAQIEESDRAIATASQESGDLRRELADARSNNADLETQVSALRAAAGEATDAARLNLIAVENQINEINAALSSVKGRGAAVPVVDLSSLTGEQQDSALPVEPRQEEGNVPEIAAPVRSLNSDWIPNLTPPRATENQQPEEPSLLAAASPSPSIAPRSAGNRQSAASSAFAGRVTLPSPSTLASPASETNLLVDELPINQRSRAQDLLSDLSAALDPRGLIMTVPGAILFAVNGEEIEPEAYDTLAKVAEIVSLYESREVLIVGHTDAVGNDGYNQKLSETRANLVRSYFVDNFDIASNRLLSEGQGERSPISSNATAEGRDANRRIEVILLN